MKQEKETRGKVVGEKWLSDVQNVVNRHRCAGTQKFHKCSHQKMTRAEVDETDWLDFKSDAYAF